MKYYRFELTNDSTGELSVYLVRRDSVGYWWEIYVNALDCEAHLTTRGSLEIPNEYRRTIKI